MVVLSALVCAVGLSASSPHLVRHGLLSAAWRAREGSLKLVVAGLLLSPSGGSTTASEGAVTPRAAPAAAAAEGGVKEGVRGEKGCRKAVTIDSKTGKEGDDGLEGRGSHGEESFGGILSGDGVEGGGEGGRSKARGGASSRRGGGEIHVTPRRRMGAGVDARGSPFDDCRESEEMLDREQLLRDVGSLLADERPEVGGVRGTVAPMYLGFPEKHGLFCLFADFFKRRLSQTERRYNRIVTPRQP